MATTRTTTSSPASNKVDTSEAVSRRYTTDTFPIPTCSSTDEQSMGLKRVLKRDLSKSSIYAKNVSDYTNRPSWAGVLRASHASRVWRKLVLSKHTSTTVSSPTKKTYENTFRMDPKDGDKFRVRQVSEILEEVLKTALENVVYNNIVCKSLCADLSGAINERVKELHFPRYKFVCHVTIVERKGQSVQVDSRCLWNKDTDNFSSATYTNGTLSAVANVFGTHFE